MIELLWIAGGAIGLLFILVGLASTPCPEEDEWLKGLQSEKWSED